MYPHPPTSPAESIESFAQLCARLDDPFADRAAVLGAAGLNERAWRRAEERWIELLRSSPEEGLVQRFGDAYAAARHAPAVAARSDVACASGVGFLSAEVQPWRAEAAAVPLSAENDAPLRLPTLADEDTAPGAPPSVAPPDVEQTLEVPVFRPGPAMPFTPGPVSSGSAPAEPKPLGTMLPPPLAACQVDAPEPIDATLAMPAQHIERPVLPFASASSPLGKRLARFDPQTGQPLPTPIWIDDPSAPKR